MNQSASQRKGLAQVFLAPGERRLRAGFRLLGQLFLLLLCTAIFGIFLGVFEAFYPALRGEYALLASQVTGFLAVVASVLLARRWLDRRSFLSLGLSWNSSALRDIGVGVLIGGLMMGLIFALEWAAGWLSFQGFAFRSESLAQVLAGALSMLVVFTAGAFAEELLHRGYWLQNLEQGLNLFWAVILSSLFFSALHIPNPNFGFAAFLGLVLSGVFLAYGYVRTRLLWLPIGLHISWNLFESTIFGYSVSGLEGLPRLIYQSVSGPELITGGGFGPEAGLVLLPALGLGAGLVYIYTRHRLAKNP